MLDTGFLIKNWAAVKPKLHARGASLEALDRFRNVYDERRNSITESETLKSKINELSQRIAQGKRSGTDVANCLPSALI